MTELIETDGPTSARETSVAGRAQLEESVAHGLANDFAAVEGSAVLLRDQWDNLSEAQRAEMHDVLAAGTRHLSRILVPFVASLPIMHRERLDVIRNADPFGSLDSATT